MDPFQTQFWPILKCDRQDPKRLVGLRALGRNIRAEEWKLHRISQCLCGSVEALEIAQAQRQLDGGIDRLVFNIVVAHACRFRRL